MVAETVDRDALLDAVVQAGFEPVTPRLIESWIYKGLLPRPTRTGHLGRTPQWRYPPETPDQVVAICRWRKMSRDLDAIRVAVWLEGFDQDLAAVRASLLAVLTDIQRQAQGFLHKEGGIEAASRRLAAARGLNNPLRGPTRTRSLALRTQSVEAMLRLFLFGDITTFDHETGIGVERLLSIRPGRYTKIGDTPPWLKGREEDIANAAPTV